MHFGYAMAAVCTLTPYILALMRSTTTGPGTSGSQPDSLLWSNGFHRLCQRILMILDGSRSVSKCYWHVVQILIERKHTLITQNPTMHYAQTRHGTSGRQ
ncbi:hypothetical protein BDZ89DRAFT_313456 [Hymenopellis radicata]|nr:hypothetical protein BDZ89DRAFT_468262 [Hymenopellis radicata]KAF9019502.1 hypothetical protein BDZ89DRAFT_313456 [Hymenopellis radicata]